MWVGCVGFDSSFARRVTTPLSTVRVVAPGLALPIFVREFLTTHGFAPVAARSGTYFKGPLGPMYAFAITTLSKKTTLTGVFVQRSVM